MLARGGGAILALFAAVFAAPFVAVWGIITLAFDRRWREAYTGFLAVAIPAATIWWIYRRASAFDDPGRQVAIGSVAVVSGYIYLFYACYAFWGVKKRLRFIHRSRQWSRQSLPLRPNDRAMIRRNATALLALSSVLLSAGALYGDYLYRSELGWAEVGLYWIGLWLLLRGFYGVVLLGYLAVDRSEIL